MATTALLTALGYKPPPPTLSPVPQRLCDLNFVNPATVFDVRHNLSVAPARSVFERFSTRFRAADIAFLATGASSDSKHIPPTGDFHPDFDAFYAATPGENRNAMRQAFRSELETLLHDLVRKTSAFEVHSDSALRRQSGTTQPAALLSFSMLMAQLRLKPR
jgi:hypothetical protein